MVCLSPGWKLDLAVLGIVLARLCIVLTREGGD